MSTGSLNIPKVSDKTDDPFLKYEIFKTLKFSDLIAADDYF